MSKPAKDDQNSHLKRVWTKSTCACYVNMAICTLTADLIDTMTQYPGPCDVSSA